MTVKSFKQAHELLAQYIPRANVERGAYTLERMQQIMAALGDPQDKYKTIHVAGTSGKTSTAYYLAAMLKTTGAKAGLMVSPHVDEINERAQIDLHPLDEKPFCKKLSEFLKLVEQIKIKPTYFELLIAFGFWLMAEEAVEYVVVEVGLGGLLDCTNVITRPDKICVITDIGFDHTQVLGRSLHAIAAQKSGIIQSYNKVVMYEQDDEVMQIVREVAEREQAELHEVWPLTAKELPASLPLFQRRNWYLALMVYVVLSSRDNLPELNESQLSESSQVYIPARMEIIAHKEKTIIVDGAHNAQKLESLAGSIKAKYPKQKVAVLFSLLHSKADRLRSNLEPLLSLADQVIITTFDTEYSAGKTSMNPLKIAEACDALGYQNWQIIDSPKAAFKALQKCEEPILLVTGSFYLLNHIRPLLRIEKQR